MSITDKLVVIAENEQKVYDAGYKKGKQEGGDTEAAYNQGVEDGKKAEYDAFWDAYQENGGRTVYGYAFAGNGWKTEVFSPKYNISPSSAAYMFTGFYGNRIGDVNYDIETGVNLDNVLNNLNVSLDFSNCTDFTSAFFQAHIRTLGTIDMSSCTSTSAIASAYK